MYKKVLKNLHKNEGEKHPIRAKKRHYIFSAENPKFPVQQEMSHEDTIKYLKRRGFKVEGAIGKYDGKSENSIIVYQPTKKQKHFLNRLAKRLGQESGLYSDGQAHELHYLNGENEGKMHTGYGSKFYDEEPENNYTTLSDGTHFSHTIDWKKMHDIKGYFHPLRKPSKNLKLIHYSPTSGLDTIDPNFHGKRGIGQEVKQGVPANRQAYFYLENVDPEDIVTEGSKSKYVASLGDKKIYDIANDWDGIISEAIDFANSKAKAEGMHIADTDTKRDAWQSAIKQAGYSGYYNPNFGDKHTMSHVVAMFDAIKPEAEYKITDEDHKLTSSKDFNKPEGIEKSENPLRFNQKDDLKKIISERAKKHNRRIEQHPYPHLNMILKGKLNV